MPHQSTPNISPMAAFKYFLFDFTYFTLLVPIAIGTRLFRDPLNIKASRKTGLWIDRPDAELEIEQARRQY
jgi:hypothetical protein